MCFSAVQGCLQEVEDRITYYAPILIGIGLGIAMIQVDYYYYLLIATAYLVVKRNSSINNNIIIINVDLSAVLKQYCSQNRFRRLSARKQVCLKPSCELVTTQVTDPKIRKQFVPDIRCRDAKDSWSICHCICPMLDQIIVV